MFAFASVGSNRWCIIDTIILKEIDGNRLSRNCLIPLSHFIRRWNLSI